jgi:hypothetical protein
MEDGRKTTAGIKRGVGNQKQRSSNSWKIKPLEPLAFKALLEALEAGKDGR